MPAIGVLLNMQIPMRRKAVESFCLLTELLIILILLYLRVLLQHRLRN